MITIAVLEDDRRELDRLQMFLERNAKEQHQEQQVMFYTRVKDFEENFTAQYDLIILDIELPDGNGMDLAKRIRQKDAIAVILFITHLAQYAIEGYTVEALDYVLKPVEYPSFALKMKRAFIRIQNSQQNYITLKIGTNTTRISTQDLKYVEIYKHHIRYVLSDTVIEAYGTLSKVEETLPRKGFYRCSNSFIINLRAVDKVDSANVYIGDSCIPISRAKKKELISEYHRVYGDLDEE